MARRAPEKCCALRTRMSLQSFNGVCVVFLRYIADARGRSIELEFDPSTGTLAPQFKHMDLQSQIFRIPKFSSIARQETQIQFGR